MPKVIPQVDPLASATKLGDDAKGNVLVIGSQATAGWAIAEPTPNPESRVRLGELRDAFGQQRAVLDWRLRPEDSESVARTTRLLALEVGAAAVGRVRDLFPRLGFPSLRTIGSHHHMGTTRMHRDPNRGVVDSDCRVHGLSNLFIAGSSVFPTFGTANPTLTIMALADRLADHLQGTA